MTEFELDSERGMEASSGREPVNTKSRQDDRTRLGKRVALLVEDDQATCSAMSALTASHGFEVDVARNLTEARAAIDRRVPQVVLCDIVLPDGNGLELLAAIDAARTDFVVITGKATVDTVVKALRSGALDYLTKPVDIGRLQRILDEVAAARGGAGDGDVMVEARRVGKFGRLVGRSPLMLRLYQQIARVAPTDATVLLQGETGTGKELVAHTIHDISTRGSEPFVPLNCGAISQTLIESELFGHEKGAFTGADRRHLGVFEQAKGGTLFLDEITDMPMDLQVKLLRVLESRSFSRVGGEQAIETNARVIAATNRAPEEAIRQGRMREDLFYRLRVFPIQLPPLRERPGDALVIAEHLIREKARETGRKVAIDTSAKQWIEAQHWPGNVRELRNVIERALILADDVIDEKCLRPDEPMGAMKTEPIIRAPAGGSAEPARTATQADAPADAGEVRVRVGATIAEAEKALIIATLEHVHGEKAKAARILGISLKTLYARLAVYNAARG